MKSILLMTDTRSQHSQLQDLLASTYTLYNTSSLEEGLEFLHLTKVDVVMAASSARPELLSQLFAQAKALHPYCVTLALAPALPAELVGTEPVLPPGDVFLRQPFSGSELRHVLTQAMEKQQLLEELAALRAVAPGLQPPVVSARGSGGDVSLARIGQILRNFAKAFSTNFDLPEALQVFLEAVREFLRPSRQSILVLHHATRTLEVRAHDGLAPKVAEQLRFRLDEGLPRWLMSEARLLHRSAVESQLHNATYREIQREMQALKAVVSIPLLASGTLVGILNLGERITGVPYTEDELEILCSLASHMAVGIQDITLYQTMQSHKTFTEKILRYMSSGVISIDCTEKISVCNHRAAQILGKSWADLLHEDLRALPSPLGDLLYETLHDGKTYHNHEVVLAASKVPVEMSTYQVLNEHGQVSGSVMVFDDLTVQKLLEDERRRADQLDFLHKVVGRMVHEIKNPLVSIQTFVDLLGEHNHDPEFTEQFRQVVRHDVHAIDDMTEKLVSFASKIAYRFEYQNIQAVLHDFVVSLTAERSAMPVAADVTPGGTAAEVELASTDLVPLVKYDPEHFLRALTYLGRFLLQNAAAGRQLLVSLAVCQQGPHTESGEWVYITLTGKGCKLPAEELQQLFDPFCLNQSTLVDVGPCVSQKIIEEHGGCLDVRQEKHGDTTFVVALPVTPEVTEVNTPWKAASIF